jgi:hypothetical protein
MTEFGGSINESLKKAKPEEGASMVKKILSVCVLAIGAVTAVQPAKADITITSLTVDLGNWTGSAFVGDGAIWNTYDPANWAVGATHPGIGNPVLDGFNSVNLPLGQYYLYMASYPDTGNALDFTAGLSNNTSITGVFTTIGGSPEFVGGYTQVAGSTDLSLSLVSPPQTAYTPVSEGQNYGSTGTANWILDVNAAPEPGFYGALALGLTGMIVAVRRRKRA